MASNANTAIPECQTESWKKILSVLTPHEALSSAQENTTKNSQNQWHHVVIYK